MPMTSLYDDPNDPRRQRPLNDQMLTPQNQQAMTRPRQVGVQLPPPPVAMPEVPDTSQVEPPNGGLNSVGQALAKYGPHYAYGPAHVDEQGHQVGTVPDTSRRGHLEALGIADPTSKVEQTPEGWQIDPAHERGRKYGVLHGLFQGALEGIARTGKWQGALGGAATGAIAGGISPKLMQGLERYQETSREQTKYNQELGNRENEQKLGLQRSQMEENQAQAERARRGTPHYERDEQGNLKAVYDTGAVQVRDVQTGEPVGRDNTTSPYQQGQLEAGKRRDEETKRYHDQMITQRKADRAVRLAIAKKRLAAKPSPAGEASVRAIVEEEAEENALERRKDTDTQIAKLRTKREQLTFSSTPKGDGTYGWEEDPAKVFESKTSVAQIDKQIADLEKESDNQQRIAETAASNKRKAEAKSRAGGIAPSWKYRGKGGSDLNHPLKGKPTGGGASKGNVTRAKFRAKYPDYAGRSDSDVDAAITGAGYTPIP